MHGLSALFYMTLILAPASRRLPRVQAAQVEKLVRCGRYNVKALVRSEKSKDAARGKAPLRPICQRPSSIVWVFEGLLQSGLRVVVQNRVWLVCRLLWSVRDFAQHIAADCRKQTFKPLMLPMRIKTNWTPLRNIVDVAGSSRMPS